MNQINHTLASVRRTRLPEEPDPIDEEEDGKRVLSRTFSTDKHLTDYIDEPSFVDEKSFIKAPLLSRLGPAPSTPKRKGKERVLEEDFESVELEVQEAQLLEDLLNVLKVCINLWGELS